MTKKISIVAIIIVLLISCESETCKIDFEPNAKLFENAVEEIHAMGLPMNSKEPYYRVVKTFKKSDNKFDKKLFNQIELIECHEDGTIIFEAPNCNSESSLSDVVYFVAYSPLGESPITDKRNPRKIKKVKQNWYLCDHVNTIAD